MFLPHSSRVLRSRSALVAAVLATVALLPAGANAATQSPVKLDGISVPTQLAGGGSFGLYKFDLQQATNGAQPRDWVAPFTEPSNAKTTQYGHCIELDQGAGQSTATLRSGDHLSLDNGGKNTIPAGDDDVRVAQLQWLLTSSYLHRADADYANGVAAGAHQSAIWKIVNPGNAANDIGTGTTARAQADAMADALVASAQANAAAMSPAGWSLTISGGNGATCAGTSRTLVVKGSPNTTAHLRITAGSGAFANGATQIDIALGSDGVAEVVLADTGSEADAIAVEATLPQWVLAQADNGGNQDFAYLKAGANVVKTVTVSFVPCRDLTVQKSAAGSFTRTYPWSVEKTAGTPVVDPAQGIATIPYTVTATRGTAVDSGFRLAGTIRVTNPNPYAVTATVTDRLTGADCVVAGSASVPAGASVDLPYTCTFTTRPTGAVTNRVELRWPRAGLADGTAAANAAPVTFATPSTTVHPAVNVVDVYNGGAAQTLGTCTQATCTYSLTKQATLPSTPTCVDVDNVAIVRDGNVDLDSSVVETSVCRTPQDLLVSRSATPSFERAYDWSVAKDVDRSSITTSDASATFTYTVTATRSAATDSGWRLAGEVTVQNPNPYAVQRAGITAGVSNGGTCAVADGTGRTVPARSSLTVTFTCSYASAPTATAGTSNVTVTSAPYGCLANQTTGRCAPTVTTLQPQAFAFDTPTAVAHPTVDVNDVFDGQAAALATGLAGTKIFVYQRTVALDGLAAGACLEKVNVARATDAADATFVRFAEQTVDVCRPTTPTPETPTTPETPVTPSGDGTTATTTPDGAATPAIATPAFGASSTIVRVTKTANRRTAAAGSQVTFTIGVQNAGKAAARSVKVCDALPRSMVFVSAKGAKYEKGQACWTRTSLKPGARATFTVVARLDQGVGVGRTCNTATATAGNATRVMARACIDTHPQRVTVTGGTVGVTG